MVVPDQVPVEPHYCDCCSSRVATFIIAIIFIVGSGLAASGCIYLLLHSQYLSDGLIIFGAITLVLVLINLLLSSIMCYGAFKDQPNKRLPWLRYNYGLFIFQLLSLIIRLMLTLDFLAFFILGIHTAFYFYMLRVVESYTDAEVNSDAPLSSAEVNAAEINNAEVVQCHEV